MSDSLVIWMCSSLERHWPDHPNYVCSGEPELECQEPSSPLIFSVPKIPFKEITTQLGEQVSSLFGLIKQREKQKEKPLMQAHELGLNSEGKSPETAPLTHSAETLLNQAILYLVKAQNKNLLPHETKEERKVTATEIVQFLEQLAAQVSRRAKIAGAEILAFSQDALSGSHKGSKPIDTNSFIKPGQRKDIFRLAQGALFDIDLKFIFNDLPDENLYSDCVTKLTEVVRRGVESEVSVVGAKKNFSF